jgi:parallel beta-helix repeat protein
MGKTIANGALFLALCGISVGASWATDFYADATLGNDSYGGSLGAPSGGNGPFKTLARLANQLKPGDRGLLKCGEVWREPLVLTTAGTAIYPIRILSYGSCSGTNKPEIRMSKTLVLQSVNSQWVGTYTQPIVMAFVNGQSASMARYPAAPQDAALAGYSSTSARFNLPDAITNLSKTDLVGSVLTARVTPDDAEERKVTDIPLTGVAQLDKSFTSQPAPGAPYYLEGKSWMNAKAGDWAWGNDAHTQLVMHGSTSGTVEVSGETNGVSLTSAHYTTISGLKITNAGGFGVNLVTSQYVTLSDLEIRNVRKAFVYVANSQNADISGISADGAQYDGIYLKQSPYALIHDNVLLNVGAPSNPKKSTGAIAVVDSLEAKVDHNYIENAAYAGIMFDVGSVVTNNVVLGACQILGDCGYVYTSGVTKGGAYFSSTVSDNLLSDKGQTVAGAPERIVAGIYLDEFSAGIFVTNNYVEGTERGIYLHNTNSMFVWDNTVFNAKVHNFMVSERGTLTSSVTYNNSVFSNTFVAPSSMPSILLDSSLGVQGIARLFGNHFATTESGPVRENWLGGSITRVLANLTGTQPDTLLVVNQSACNTSSLYWTSAITKVDPAARSQWKLWSTYNDAQRLTDAPLHVQAGATGETIASSPLFAEGGNTLVLSLSGTYSGGQTRVPVVLRQSVSPYTNRAAVMYVYPDTLGNFNLCTIFQPYASELSARLDIHLKPTDNIKVDFVGLKEPTYQPPQQRFASLINPGDTSAYLACPFTDQQSCQGARQLDQTPVAWPMYMYPRSGQVVYIP